MEPDERAAFRPGLRSDAATVLQQPHKPTGECWPSHCCWHNLDEDADGAYRVCGECFHVYRTAEDLRAVFMAEVAPLLTGMPSEAPAAEEIYACPYCAHDW
jgi:hypothetical protein